MMSPCKHLDDTRPLGPKYRSGAWLRKFVGDRAGTIALEFGFVLPIFLTFVFGTVEIGRYMWSEHALNYAAEQASRYAIANPSVSNSDVQAYTLDQLMTVDQSTVTVTVANETINGIDYLTVTASLPYSTILPLVPLGAVTLTSVARVPVT